jgi:hypothetical protein
MAVSDKDHLRADRTEFLDCRINGANEHWLVAVRRKPIGELDPNGHILFHNHHATSRAVLPVRHREISFHVCLGLMPLHAQRVRSRTTPYLLLTVRIAYLPAEVNQLIRPNSA